MSESSETSTMEEAEFDYKEILNGGKARRSAKKTKRRSRSKPKSDGLPLDIPEYTWEQLINDGVSKTNEKAMQSSFQSGEEFYYCCLINQNLRCANKIRIHPYFINLLHCQGWNDGDEESIPYEYWPVCGQHKSIMNKGRLDKELPTLYSVSVDIKTTSNSFRFNPS